MSLYSSAIFTIVVDNLVFVYSFVVFVVFCIGKIVAVCTLENRKLEKMQYLRGYHDITLEKRVGITFPAEKNLQMTFTSVASLLCWERVEVAFVGNKKSLQMTFTGTTSLLCWERGNKVSLPFKIVVVPLRGSYTRAN